MVVELCKDLFATTERPYIERTPKVIGGGGSSTTAATVSLLVEVVLELVRSTRMTKSTSLVPAGAWTSLEAEKL